MDDSSNEGARTDVTNISTETILIGAEITFDLFVQHDPSQPMEFLHAKGARPSRESIGKLLKTSNKCLYVPNDQMPAFRNYIHATVQKLFSLDKVPQADKARYFYWNVVETYAAFIEDSGDQSNFDQVCALMSLMSEQLVADEQFCSALIRCMSTKYSIPFHSINGAILASAQALHGDNADPTSLKQMAIATVFRDIGMTLINQRILNKPTQLTASEYQLIRAHTNTGRELMSQFPSISEAELDVIQCHHEMMDGSGYPQGLRNGAISPSARTAAIADTFVALTSDRTYKKRRKWFDALRVMTTQMRNKLDQSQIKGLVKLLSSIDKEVQTESK